MARTRRRTADKLWGVVVLVAILGFCAFALPGFGLVLGTLALVLAGAIVLVAGLLRSRAVRRWHAVSSLYALTPTDFENHVAETYRNLGYSVKMTPRVGDQGVDILARRRLSSIAVQCKRYADHAPNSAVQAVHAGRTHYGCNEAVLVCLGGFSNAARELAASTGVKLVDGAQYADMVAAVGPRAVASYRNFIPRGTTLLYAIALLIIGVLALAINKT